MVSKRSFDKICDLDKILIFLLCNFGVLLFTAWLITTSNIFVRWKILQFLFIKKIFQSIKFQSQSIKLPLRLRFVKYFRWIFLIDDPIINSKKIFFFSDIFENFSSLTFEFLKAVRIIILKFEKNWKIFGSFSSLSLSYNNWTHSFIIKISKHWIPLQKCVITQ
jgi:hypothetical protein